MLTIGNIREILTENRELLFKRYNLRSIGLFGSYVKNKNAAKSDIDIIVDFNGSIGIEFIELAEELEMLLKVKVDLVSKNGIKDKYFRKIEKEIVYV